MKTPLLSFSVLWSPTLRTAPCLLLLFACDDFTCEDYATCDPGDAAVVREAGSSTNAPTTTSSVHDASSSRSSTNSTNGGTHVPAASGTVVEIFIDAGALSGETDASQATLGWDASPASTQADASAQSTHHAGPTGDQDAGGLASSAGLGEICATDRDCESEHCADGVCCDSACDGVCVACDQPGALGECGAVEHDDGCGTLECPASTECRAYEATNDSANCETIGECRTQAECQIDDAPLGTPCAGNTGTCSGSGECQVPDKLGLGEECDENAECGSTYCASGAGGTTICCSTACDQTCQVCGADGQCNAAPATDEACEFTCPASTACAQFPDPPAQTCAGFGVCVSAEQYCQPDYEAEGVACGESSECDGAGECVVVDRQAPAVVGVTPNNSAANVDRDVVIEVTFSEPINGSGLSDLVTLTGPDGEVPITVILLDDVTLAVSPNVTLPLIASHELQLSAALEDLAGNELGDTFVSSFTTRDGIWDEEPKLLETENAGDVRLSLDEPAIDLDGGDILAVWGMTGSGTGSGVWAGRFNSSASQWSRSKQIAEGSTLPSLVRTGTGALAVANDFTTDYLRAWQFVDATSEWTTLPAAEFLPYQLSQYSGFGSNWTGDYLMASVGTLDGTWVLASLRRVGENWATDTIVAPQEEEIRPSIAVDPEGNAVCLFTMGGELLYATKSVSGVWSLGEPLDPGFLAETPYIHSDATGAFYGVWSRTIVDSETELPTSRVLRRFGGAWGSTSQLRSGEGQNWNLQVRGDGAGNAVASWYFTSEDNGYEIQTATYSDGSNGWGEADTHAATGSEGDEPRFPIVRFDRRGNGLLVWSNPNAQSYRHYARRFTAAQGWGSPKEFHASPNPTSFNMNSNVAWNNDGEGVVLWGQSDGTRENLWALHFR